jgi:hypothetical protein
VICLTVRRLFCGNPGCAAVTFSEQAEGLTGRYRRRSLPLLDLLTQMALALAGRAGSRLAAVLGIAVHPVTLLRLVAALPEAGINGAPPVLGGRFIPTLGLSRLLRRSCWDVAVAAVP